MESQDTVGLEFQEARRYYTIFEVLQPVKTLTSYSEECFITPKRGKKKKKGIPTYSFASYISCPFKDFAGLPSSRVSAP